MTFEVVVIAATDVDRAMSFYSRLRWRLDLDFDSGNVYRVIQFTPPGSCCFVTFGRKVSSAAPGSAQGLHRAVADIEATRADLLRRGVAVTSHEK